MDIGVLFLNVKFTEVTLLHILLLLGIPYLIFYIFEKSTKFDNFFEKWEGALFIFSFGGLITLLSLGISKFGVPFYLVYLLFLLFLILILIILKKRYFSSKNPTNTGWVKIILSNREEYIGIIIKEDEFSLMIRGTFTDKISKKEADGSKRDIDAKKIAIRKYLIDKIFFY